MSPIGTERGFALPLTVLVVTVMTIMISSVYVRVRADRVVAESTGSTVDALAVAQSGLQRFMAYYDSMTPPVRPLDGDSIRLNVPNGYADVVARKVQSPADTMEPETYIVRSTGHLIEPQRGSEPQAVRTVAQFAQWQSAAMRITAALTAANGLSVVNPLAGVNGNDQHHVPEPSAPGVRTPAGTVPDVSDFDFISGSPALVRSGSGPGVATVTGIDWASIVGGQFRADYDAFQPGLAYPSMLIFGDLTITDGVGSGLLIVTGDLSVTGTYFGFEGVILVGGRLLTSNSLWTDVRGATVTGLNEQLGLSPQQSVLGGTANPLYFLYQSCEVRTALSSLVGFVPLRNAWMDNWATY